MAHARSAKDAPQDRLGDMPARAPLAVSGIAGLARGIMSEPDHPAIPRLSATVLLVRDDPFEVLMVRRSTRRSDAFSAALVFPGGVVDPEDEARSWIDLAHGGDDLPDRERALRVAACRETFEEAGILLADDAIGACPAAGQTFPAFVQAAGARLRLDRLVHFAHWITPSSAPRRFDTHFYLCRAPDGAEAMCDGSETVALEWVSPRLLLDRAAAKTEHVVFPTRMNLRRLAESADVDGALAAARARPRFTVEPRTERRGDTLVVVIPAEAGYGVTEDVRPG
jgi:8-oxo-dGTP pyrophosphatase MutT (NUDIX family)